MLARRDQGCSSPPFDQIGSDMTAKDRKRMDRRWEQQRRCLDGGIAHERGIEAMKGAWSPMHLDCCLF